MTARISPNPSISPFLTAFSPVQISPLKSALSVPFKLAAAPGFYIVLELRMNILLQVKQSFDVFWIFRFKGIKNAFVIALGNRGVVQYRFCQSVYENRMSM